MQLPEQGSSWASKGNRRSVQRIRVQRRAERAQRATRAKRGTASPLKRHVRRYGSGTSRSRQIFRARNSLISRCRGTVEVFAGAAIQKDRVLGTFAAQL